VLVLTRKIGESLMIGDNIRITVVSINEWQVRLGIEAPPNVLVYREELLGREPASAADEPQAGASGTCGEEAATGDKASAGS
jgi:carbon storage regulator